MKIETGKDSLIQFKQFRIEALQKEVVKLTQLLEGYKLIIEQYQKNEKHKFNKDGYSNRKIKES